MLYNVANFTTKLSLHVNTIIQINEVCCVGRVEIQIEI